MKTYCKFCMQIVEEDHHVVDCPMCKGKLHVISGSGNCATCGRPMPYPPFTSPEMAASFEDIVSPPYPPQVEEKIRVRQYPETPMQLGITVRKRHKKSEKS